MKPSNCGPAAVAAAFERADAIVALEGFVPDAGYRAIQRRVIADELTSGVNAGQEPLLCDGEGAVFSSKFVYRLRRAGANNPR